MSVVKVSLPSAEEPCSSSSESDGDEGQLTFMTEWRRNDKDKEVEVLKTTSSSTPFKERKQAELVEKVRNPLEQGGEYYSKIPFGPGVEFFKYLLPLHGKANKGDSRHTVERERSKAKQGENGLPKDVMDGCLHLRIPETLILNKGSRIYMHYSPRKGCIVDQVLPMDWQSWLQHRWSRASRVDKDESDPVLAVLKTPSWQSPCSSNAIVLLRSSMKHRMDEPPERCVLQRFVKCKGTKASIYRACWNKTRTGLTVFNMINEKMFTQAQSRHEQQQHHVFEEEPGRKSTLSPQKPTNRNENAISMVYCASSSNLGGITIFKIASKATGELLEATRRVVTHVQKSLMKAHGLYKLYIEEIVCDFLRTERNHWCLINVKAFRLSRISFLEAERLMQELLRRKEERGDYYDSDEERETLRRIRKGKRKPGQSNPARSRRAPKLKTRDTTQCKLCGRWWRAYGHTEKQETDSPPSSPFSQSSSQSSASDTEEARTESRESTTEQKQQDSVPETRVDETSTLKLPEIIRAYRENLMNPDPDFSLRLGSPPHIPDKVPRTEFPDHVMPEPDGKNREYGFRMTEIMARALTNQLALRGRGVMAFSHGILRQFNAQEETARDLLAYKTNDGDFPVCDLCYELWVCNENCLKVGREWGRGVLPFPCGENSRMGRKPHLPGDPSYGIKLGSSVRLEQTRAGNCLTAAQVAANEVLAQHAAMEVAKKRSNLNIVDSKLVARAAQEKFDASNKRRQYRLALFFRDIIDGIPSSENELVELETSYKLCAHHPRQVFKTKSLDIKQARMHYFFASSDDVQHFFVSKRIRVQVIARDCKDSRLNQKYEGNVYLTKYLSSLSRIMTNSMHEFPVPMVGDRSGEICLRVSIGIVFDNVDPSQLDPKVPMYFHDGIYYLPHNYFDLRPMPRHWMEVIVRAPSHQEVQDALQKQREQERMEQETFVQLQQEQPRRASSMPVPTMEALKLDGMSNTVASLAMVKHKIASARKLDSDHLEWWAKIDELHRYVSNMKGRPTVKRSELLTEVMLRASEQKKHQQEDPNGDGKYDRALEMDWVSLVTLLQRSTAQEKKREEYRRTVEAKLSAANVQPDIVSIASKSYNEERLSAKQLREFLRLRMAETLVIDPSSSNDEDTVGRPKQDNENHHSTALVFATGVFSQETRKEAVKRRRWRLNQYKRIWYCIDFDQSGMVDIAELRSYMRQRGRDRPINAINNGPFNTWKIEDLHAHFCAWLGNSEKCQRKFDRYDTDASGMISWKEMYNMAEEAFRGIAMDELSFAMSELHGDCPKHGLTKMFSIDLQCSLCEFEHFDPTIYEERDIDIVEQVHDEVQRATKSVATKLKSLVNPSQPAMPHPDHKRKQNFPSYRLEKNEEETEKKHPQTLERKDDVVKTPQEEGIIKTQEEEDGDPIQSQVSEEEEFGENDDESPNENVQEERAISQVGTSEDEDTVSTARTIQRRRKTRRNTKQTIERLQSSKSFREMKQQKEEQEQQEIPHRLSRRSTRRTTVHKSKKFRSDTIIERTKSLRRSSSSRKKLLHEELELAAEKEALFVYIKHGSISQARRLFVESKLPSANFTHRGLTPLHVAASNGRYEMIEFLLKRGADRNALDENGLTAAELAVLGNHHDVMKLLD